MSLDERDPRLAPLAGRPSAYGWTLLRRAGEHALELHADAVAAEHVLGVLMADEESAAHAAVLHAFADPDTIRTEALALAPGLLVVASDSTLPFSPQAVRALRRARAEAAAAGSAEVTLDRLLGAAVAALPAEVAGDLRAAGYRPPEAPPGEAAAGGAEPDAVPEEGPLFRRFSTAAKRALSQGNRLAAAGGAAAIAPGHLALGCLRADDALAARAGIAFLGARAALAGRAADDSRPEPRDLPPDEGLLAFLERLPAGAGSLEMLAALLDPDTPELAQLLARHKVSAALLERARGAFRDPR